MHLINSGAEMQSNTAKKFVATFITQQDVRFKTSRTAASFVEPSTRGDRGNEAGGKWYRVKPGTVFHLISVTRSPDAATLLMEQDGTEVSMILREKGWTSLKGGLKSEDRRRLDAMN